jgi:hypothetical protein
MDRTFGKPLILAKQTGCFAAGYKLNVKALTGFCLYNFSAFNLNPESPCPASAFPAACCGVSERIYKLD